MRWDPGPDPYEDDGPMVCVAHNRFIPCRRSGICIDSSDPQDVEMVRRYQQGECDMPEVNEVNHVKFKDWAGDDLAAYFDPDRQIVVFTVEPRVPDYEHHEDSIELSLDDSVALATWILSKA